MSEIDISFLREVYKKEKNIGAPFKVPFDFYKQVRAYLNGLPDDERGRLERKNAEKVFAQIVELRFAKIARMAAAGLDNYIEMLTPEEKNLLEKMRALFQQFIKGDDKIEIIILEDIPEYTNFKTMKKYGPFQKHQTVLLDYDEALFLVKKGKAMMRTRT